MNLEKPMAAQSYIHFDRIRNHTPSYVNERIDLLTQAQIDHIASQGREAIERRIVELDHEWDIDRALMLNFAIAGGAAFAAGVFGRKNFFYLLAAQMVFLGLHATRGWCPPVSVFRRMNFRTRNEIEAEKHRLLSALGMSESRRAA